MEATYIDMLHCKQFVSAVSGLLPQYEITGQRDRVEFPPGRFKPIPDLTYTANSPLDKSPSGSIDLWRPCTSAAARISPCKSCGLMKVVLSSRYNAASEPQGHSATIKICSEVT